MPSPYLQSSGASGARNALQDMIAEKLQAEALAREIQQKQIDNDLKSRQVAVSEASQKSVEQDRADRLAATEQNNKVGGALRLAPLLKPGQTVAPADAQTFRDANMGSLLQDQIPQMPSTQFQGTANAPGLYSAPQKPVGTVGEITTPGQAARTTFTGTQTQEDEAAKEAEAARVHDLQNEVATAKADAAAAKQPTNSYQLQPEIDPATGKQTGKFLGYNTKTNRWEPVQGQGPDATKAAPGAAQANVDAGKKKDAMSTLDQVDQAIDNAKDLIGPGAGRVSSVEQMIGNPDPRINTLGTKLLMAKMKVDAGIGGARAAASPQLLARWDKLMGQQMDAASLKASIQAMREILGATGDTPAASGAHVTIKSIRQVP